MRLYIKFLALSLAAASLQRMAFSDAPPSELWFDARCWLACVIQDKQMINRLADEVRDQRHIELSRINARGG